eukprot:scaffold112570_cov68-Phaeocystis_antarctica.AAC.1
MRPNAPRAPTFHDYTRGAVTPPDPAPHSITFRKNLPVHCVRRGGPRGGYRDDKCRTRRPEGRRMVPVSP